MTFPLTPTLEEVAAAFNEWRATADKRRATIPERLRQQAVSLLPHYPMSQILATLRMNRQQMSLWKRRGSVSEPPAFVTLEPTREVDALTLTWSTQTARGIPMSVTGTLPPEQWRTVLLLLNRAGG